MQTAVSTALQKSDVLPVALAGALSAHSALKDYGTDLDKAIDAAQVLIDTMVEHFFETSAGSKARLAPYLFSQAERAGISEQLHDTDNAGRPPSPIYCVTARVRPRSRR
jgi:hypothetical protein